MHQVAWAQPGLGLHLTTLFVIAHAMRVYCAAKTNKPHMDYLQEKLLGEKVAVSTILLALTQNIQLAEAERVLTEFYDSHKDTLDAAFQVTTKSGMKTSIKTLSANEVPADASSVRIYVVSTERASDPAVINGVAKAVSEFQLRLTIGDLKKAGYSVNPALDTNFTVETSGRFFGPISDVLGNHAPRPNSSATALAPTPSIAPDSGIAKREETKGAFESSKALQNKEVAKMEPSEAATDTKPLPGRQLKRTFPVKQNNRASAPKKTTAFPFAKVNKDEALAFNRQPAQRPVHEKIIISDANDNDDNDDNDEEAENASRGMRQQQMENLKGLYDDEHSIDVKPEDAMLDVDEGSSSGSSEIKPEEEPEMNMDMEPLSQQGVVEQFHGDAPEDQTSALARDSAEDSTTMNSEATKPPGKKTRRILKTIVTKDEEGFDVRERIFVDEDVEDVEDAEDKDTGNVAPMHSSTRKEPKIGVSASRSSINSKTENKPKAPPTIKKGNQTNLMSFFTKGK